MRGSIESGNMGGPTKEAADKRSLKEQGFTPTELRQIQINGFTIDENSRATQIALMIETALARDEYRKEQARISDAIAALEKLSFEKEKLEAAKYIFRQVDPDRLAERSFVLPFLKEIRKLYGTAILSIVLAIVSVACIPQRSEAQANQPPKPVVINPGENPNVNTDALASTTSANNNPDLGASGGTGPETVATQEISSTVTSPGNTFALAKWQFPENTDGKKVFLSSRTTEIPDLKVRVDAVDSITGIPLTVTVSFGTQNGDTFGLQLPFAEFDRTFTATEKQSKTKTELVALLPLQEWGKATTTVNIRKGPGTNYETVGLLTSKDPARRIIEKQDGWSKIGDDEWVSSDYIKVTVPESVGGSESNKDREALANYIAEQLGLSVDDVDLVPSPPNAGNEITALVGDAVVATIKVNGEMYDVTFLLTDSEIASLKDREQAVATTPEPQPATTPKPKPTTVEQPTPTATTEAPVTIPPQLTEITESDLAARKVEKLEGASKYYVGPGNTVLGFDNKGVLLGIKNPFEPDWIARTSTNKDVAVLSSEGLWTWNGEGAGSVNERLTVDFVQSVIDKYPIQDKEKETQIKEEIARLLSLNPAQTLIGISSLIISEGDVSLAQENSAKYNVSELEFAVGWRPDAQYANFHNDGQVGTRGSAFVVSDTLYMLTDFYAPSDIGADGASFWRIVIKSMIEMMDKSTTINIDNDPIYQRFRTDISYDPIRHIIIDPLVKGK